MSKDTYFEMCEMMGSEPIESEIPVEYADLPEEVQEAVIVYNMLQDNWDTMNGHYLGKAFTGVKDVMDIAGVEDRQTCFTILQLLDSHRSAIVNTKKPAN